MNLTFSRASFAFRNLPMQFNFRLSGRRGSGEGNTSNAPLVSFCQWFVNARLVLAFITHNGAKEGWEERRERGRKGGRETFFLLAFVLSFCIFCNLKRFPLSFGSSLFALPLCLHSSPLAHSHNDRPCLACGSTMG